MRFFSIIFLALVVAGCSRRSVEVSVTNHSGLRVSVLYVCNGHSCQRVTSLASGATVRVTEPLAGEGLSLTYWIEGQCQRQARIPDDMIRSGVALLTIETNYLVKP